MQGVSPEIMVHKLNVHPEARPVKQKKRAFGVDRNRIIKEEVEKLLKINYIRPVQYPEWLANVVLVPKNNGKWRMCIDFTDLNRACPKDSFPLPRIDAMIDSTSGCELMSFLDAFQGYNQIRLAPEDQEKTSFVTEQGTYCYTVMPFGLKNAGATYQRLVNSMFQKQIGKNMEVYIDDMLVKSQKKEHHINDLTECFEILKKFGMKLNPSKCTFGVRGGKFLGFMVSQRGIEANPEKIEAIINMQPPGTTKEVQKLTGRIAALNRFISSLRKPEKVPHFTTTLDKAETRRNVVPIFGDIRGGSKCGLGKRRGPRASTHILCQQDPPGAGREIPPNREVGISPGDSCPKVEAIFPITSCGRSNEPPTKEDPGQPKHFRANGEMVHRVERTWY
ncbi:UNVERIFIED_CONTAM: Transposon Ty3-G Gag-Pol polyprotein [Sesamum radiatum]|uniref:Transposon Ty3-G Gag-Pol polyprotein n=1 Tax=Sesamum radiatum TaxID=300843 RepID=A0AAW2JKG7_SESRA